MNSQMLPVNNASVASMPDSNDREQDMAMYGAATEGQLVPLHATERYRAPSLSAQASGTLRAVLYEPDPEIRARLHSLIAGDPTLIVAAEPRSWPECQAVLEEVLPELLVLRAELMPSLRDKPEEPAGALPVAVDLAGPLLRTARGQRPAGATEAIRNALDQALQEIYSRKVKQLAYLIRRYLSAPESKQRYPSLLNVDCDGHSVDVGIDEVTAVIARRKHVSIYSTIGHFTLREPMGIVAGKLDPELFARIHRSTFVNIRHLDRVRSSKEQAILQDGAAYPVGPSYRAMFGELLLSGR
jgi:two-component system LytT family response regulator